MKTFFIESIIQKKMPGVIIEFRVKFDFSVILEVKFIV